VRALAVAAAVVAFAALLAGCSAPPRGDVKMGDQSFDPPTFVTTVNKTVTWANPSSLEHTVTSDTLTGSFISDRIEPGGTWSFAFAEPGTYRYHCALHASRLADGSFVGQVGTIVVRAGTATTG
jgi:plastocyanin